MYCRDISVLTGYDSDCISGIALFYFPGDLCSHFVVLRWAIVGRPAACVLVTRGGGGQGYLLWEIH